jgi:CheY-like chemotaxis protein
MPQSVRIALIEDNPADVRLFKEAFRDAGPSEIVTLSDGEQALDYLYRSMHSGAMLPNLIVLDLNLPKVHGFEVLERIKADGHLKRMPVAILSTSAADRDIRRAYELHANCYLKKPIDLDDYELVCSALKRFWGEVVTLPATCCPMPAKVKPTLTRNAPAHPE